MRILVTGGTGFIGGRVAEALLSQPEIEVTIAGRKRPARCRPLDLGADFIAGDLTDAAFAKRACVGVQAIVHCAGMAGTWGAYEDYRRANVLATENLLQAARAAGVERFVNISSPSIYFQFKDQLGLKETDLPRRFSNAYAQTKYEAEQIVQSYDSPELKTVSLRPRAVIGRGDQNIMPRFIRLAKEGRLVQIGRGENIVDFTAVENLNDAIFLCLQASPPALGTVYNISNGKPMRLWDFADQALAAAGLPIARRKLPYSAVMLAAKLNEWGSRLLRRRSEPALLPISVGVISFSMTLDISKAREKLGYTPRLTTEDGIKSFFQP